MKCMGRFWTSFSHRQFLKNVEECEHTSSLMVLRPLRWKCPALLKPLMPPEPVLCRHIAHTKFSQPCNFSRRNLHLLGFALRGGGGQSRKDGHG